MPKGRNWKVTKQSNFLIIFLIFFQSHLPNGLFSCKKSLYARDLCTIFGCWSGSYSRGGWTLFSSPPPFLKTFFIFRFIIVFEKSLIKISLIVLFSSSILLYFSSNRSYKIIWPSTRGLGWNAK